MRRLYILLIFLVLAGVAGAQQYDITFRLEGATDSVMYIARHFRDELQSLDSTRRAADGSYRFRGKRQWQRGIYALVGPDRTKAISDFTIDGSQRFSITADAKLTPSTVKVVGSPANTRMFDYMATLADARQQIDDIRRRKQDPATRAQAEADEKSLFSRMDAYDRQARDPKNATIFTSLISIFDEPEVPDTIADRARYFRHHYWDRFFARSAEPTLAAIDGETLRHSPNLFNKVNQFFFGLLYHASPDTICMEIDYLADRFDDDTAMLRYVFDFIEPRYFRSTRNIGWDAVWCHLASEYYLKGRCPWASEATLHNIRYNYNRLRQSLIGAHGQELWMADTNQSTNPKDWISSHRFPNKYVILWFWDPDCHHCQEQSAELKVLYDSLLTAPYRPFEVYAVGYEADVEKWKRYVREHDFRWVNVGGTNVNIDYQEAYNVHGAPTMIILDEKRDIIMNKTIPVKYLMQFLADHEKNAKH